MSALQTFSCKILHNITQQAASDAQPAYSRQRLGVLGDFDKQSRSDWPGFLACNQGSLVGLCMQDCKSLCAAVTTCSTLVNIHTHRHRQTAFDQVIWKAQLKITSTCLLRGLRKIRHTRTQKIRHTRIQKIRYTQAVVCDVLTAADDSISTQNVTVTTLTLRWTQDDTVAQDRWPTGPTVQRACRDSTLQCPLNNGHPVNAHPFHTHHSSILTTVRTALQTGHARVTVGAVSF